MNSIPHCVPFSSVSECLRYVVPTFWLVMDLWQKLSPNHKNITMTYHDISLGHPDRTENSRIILEQNERFFFPH